MRNIFWKFGPTNFNGNASDYNYKNLWILKTFEEIALTSKVVYLPPKWCSKHESQRIFKSIKFQSLLDFFMSIISRLKISKN